MLFGHRDALFSWGSSAVTLLSMAPLSPLFLTDMNHTREGPLGGGLSSKSHCSHLQLLPLGHPVSCQR